MVFGWDDIFDWCIVYGVASIIPGFAVVGAIGVGIFGSLMGILGAVIYLCVSS